jgi:hypothetical protein
MQGVFGGSKKKEQSTSETGNRAFDSLSPTLLGQSQLGASSGNFLAQLLGLQGGSEGANAMSQFKDSSAYDFLQSEGSNAVSQNNAAKGLLASGATARGITDRATNMANTFQTDYLDRLFGLGTQGNQSASILSDAGRYSKGQSTSSASEKPGMFGDKGPAAFLGTLLSDPRLKTNIEKLGEMYDGLGLYAWNYIWGGARKIGVMADEVAKLRPWALGPEIEGYKTVNYRRL